ncbi:MAG TPA: alkaline phosphatase family protein [Desulfarculaceae bacterium]|nr:alkaline phosphatase family protein [Desulfarculaceae bacterium]
MKDKRVVVLDVVGLSMRHFENSEYLPNLSSLRDQGRLSGIKPVFPAVTLPVQASMTTGCYPEKHGIVANGFFSSETLQVSFWDQPAGLVQAERIWDRLKRKNPGLITAALFMQNTLYAGCDCVITPKPMHTDDGLVQWCYSKPVGFYEQVCDELGEFNLMDYWGPMTSIGASRWIAGAAVETMASIRPHLMFVYLPHLDYCTQKLGPDHPNIGMELQLVDREVGRIVQGIEDLGLKDETTFIVLSEYEFYKVEGAIDLNRIFRRAGLLRVRTIQNREYLDFELSPAFAMVDHQIAHIYIKSGYEKKIRAILEGVAGIDFLFDQKGKEEQWVNHARAGAIIAVSARNKWFSYYWWDDSAREPDFAGHVDIHRKPGYDPLELFFDHETKKISQDTSLIRGSHGYPPLTDDDLLPFIISGEAAVNLPLTRKLCVTDLSSIIEEILVTNEV